MAGLQPVKKQQADETPDWTDYRDKLGSVFGRTVTARAKAYAAKKELEDEIAGYDAVILAGMQKIPEKSVMVDGVRATYIEQVRVSIDKGALSDNLLKLGLKADVVQGTIEKSSKESRSEFVRITAPRE